MFYMIHCQQVMLLSCLAPAYEIFLLDPRVIAVCFLGLSHNSIQLFRDLVVMMVCKYPYCYVKTCSVRDASCHVREDEACLATTTSVIQPYHLELSCH